jgi:hypothetical protein
VSKRDIQQTQQKLELGQEKVETLYSIGTPVPRFQINSANQCCDPPYYTALIDSATTFSVECEAL